MTHEGPEYGKLGGTHTEEVDYIGGTSTYDNLRNHDDTWNGGRGLWVTWTDGYNQKHKVTLKDKTDEFTVLFPVSGKDVNWYNGPDQQWDRTGFDALCTWAQVKFFYATSNWTQNHGIRIHLKGYSGIKCRDVDWDRVRKGLDAGKTITEIAKDLAEIGGKAATGGAV